MDRKRAEEELENWGRWLYSDMESHGIAITGHVMPPTSSGYRAPPYIEGETPETRIPVDELLGEETMIVVKEIGLENFDYYRVLCFWYSRITNPGAWPRTIKRRMAELLKISQDGSERMLDRAIDRYHEKRLQSKRKVC